MKKYIVVAITHDDLMGENVAACKFQYLHLVNTKWKTKDNISVCQKDFCFEKKLSGAVQLSKKEAKELVAELYSTNWGSFNRYFAKEIFQSMTALLDRSSTFFHHLLYTENPALFIVQYNEEEQKKLTLKELL